MKTEPLNNKRVRMFLQYSKEQPKSDGYYHNYFNEMDIKSAVKWLKEQIMPNQKIKEFSQWQIIDLINKAFKDIIKKEIK